MEGVSSSVVISPPVVEDTPHSVVVQKDRFELRYTLAPPADGWWQSSAIHTLLWIPGDDGIILSASHTLCVWQVQKAVFSCILSHPLKSEAVKLAYDSERRTIFVATAVGTVKMFNLAAECNQLNEYPLMTFETEDEKAGASIFSGLLGTPRCVGVFFNRQSDYLLAVRADGRLLLHDFSLSQKRLGDIADHQGYIKVMAYDAQSHRMFLGSFGGIVSVYNIAGKKLAQITGIDGFSHNGSVNTLAYDQATSILVSGGYDKLIKMWPIPNAGQEKDCKIEPLQTFGFPDSEHTFSDTIEALTIIPSKPLKLIVAHGAGIHVFEGSAPKVENSKDPILSSAVLQGHKSGGVSSLLYIQSEQLLLAAGAQIKLFANVETLSLPREESSTLLALSLERTNPHPMTISEVLEDDVRESVLQGKMSWQLLELLACGALDVDSADRVTGHTPLHLACAQGDIYALQLLIKEKADVRCENEKDRKNVFHYAASFSNLDRTEDIQQRKKTIIDILKRHIGTEKKEGDLGKKHLKRLLKATDVQGMTPIMLAVNSWAPKPVVLVDQTSTLKTPTDLHQPSRSPSAPSLPPTVGVSGERTLLHHLLRLYALVFTPQRLCEILDNQDNMQSTALHYAVFSEMLGNVEILCKLGADVNIQNRVGFTPLHIAVVVGNDDMLPMLFEPQELCPLPCNLNIQDDDGNTPLHYACSKKGHRRLIRQLLETGTCDTTIRNNNGQTPAENLKTSLNEEDMALWAKYAKEKEEGDKETELQVMVKEDRENRQKRLAKRIEQREVGSKNRRKEDKETVRKDNRFKDFVNQYKAFELKGLQLEQLAILKELFLASLQEIDELMVQPGQAK